MTCRFSDPRSTAPLLWRKQRIFTVYLSGAVKYIHNIRGPRLFWFRLIWLQLSLSRQLAYIGRQHLLHKEKKDQEEGVMQENLIAGMSVVEANEEDNKFYPLHGGRICWEAESRFSNFYSGFHYISGFWTFGFLMSGFEVYCKEKSLTLIDCRIKIFLAGIKNAKTPDSGFSLGKG